MLEKVPSSVEQQERNTTWPRTKLGDVSGVREQALCHDVFCFFVRGPRATVFRHPLERLNCFSYQSVFFAFFERRKRLRVASVANPSECDTALS